MTIPVANVLQPLIDVAHEILSFWHDLGFSWGASIIMLTVVIRLAILPLTFKQVRSMQDLQRLQPEMKRIQERYKEDRQRMNQEMMKLYQEHKVNPLGSCLPILLQLPFFIALFYLLQDDLRRDICGPEIEAAGRQVSDTPCDTVLPGSADFLFIPDLTDTATGGVLIALIVLYVSTQLVSGLVSTVTADPTQRRIILALPFIFVIFIINFEAGLIVYWITTNTWTIGQQFLVRKLFPKPDPIEAKPDAGSKPARGKPPSKAKAAAAADDGAAKGAKSSGDGGPKKGPPPGPRKKKKRTGRRR